MRIAYFPRVALAAPLALALTLGCDNSPPVFPIGSDSDASTDTHDASDGQEDGGHIPDLHDIPDGATGGALMCAELGSLCHDFDLGDGELGDRCHDIGHAGDPDDCEEVYEECIEFCSEHGHGDAGHHDAGHHEEVDGGAALCQELGHRCHGYDDGGTNLGSECHHIGHSGNVSECIEHYDECIAACPEDHDAG
jgi:hypothetical protein